MINKVRFPALLLSAIIGHAAIAADGAPAPSASAEAPAPAAPPVPAQSQVAQPNEVGHGGGYVAAMAGPGIVTSPGQHSTDFTYAAELAGSFRGNKNGAPTLGAYFIGGSDNTLLGGVQVTQSLAVLMGEYLARRAFDTGLYFGARVGAGFLSASVSGGAAAANASGTSFAFEPVAGYEIAASPSLSIPIEVTWLTVQGGTLTFAAGRSVDYDPIQIVTFQTGIRFSW